MRKPLMFLPVIFFVCILAACQQSPTKPTEIILDTSTAEPVPTEAPLLTPPRVLFSEVLAGAQGNNNFDFIELYNPGSAAPFDLKGASLWYQLADDREEILVYQWNAHALIPPLGHYLLARSGEDFGIAPDAWIDEPIVPQRGSLQIRSETGEVLDSLTWGNGSQAFAEGEAADAMPNGISLERAPGGEAGNASDEDQNNIDFILNEKPNPQNSGSPITPLVEGGQLSVQIEAPASVEPGQTFDILISVSNPMEWDLHQVVVQVPIPLELEVQTLPETMAIRSQPTYWELPQIRETHQVLEWSIEQLQAGVTQAADLQVKAPWTYATTLINNYYVVAKEWPQGGFGGPVYTNVEGGAVPIGIARGFANEEIVVEGIATMYTGGYYAGGGNTKFYIEDETGGIQVWVDDGEGDVNVELGDRVRVQGILLVYRGAMELAPTPEGVEVLEKGSEASIWPATQASVEDAATDAQNLPGRLVQAQGTVARVEEFTYSYEIDLVDEAGHILNVYIDKLTGINVEAVESGQPYQITGVLEVRDSNQLLYPRIQSDLRKVYAPGLYLDVSVPNMIGIGETINVQLTVTNHAPETMRDVIVTAPIPKFDLSVESVTHDGFETDGAVSWIIPELPSDGGVVTVAYQAISTTSREFIRLEPASAASADGSEQTESLAQHIFLQGSIPVWAIQGEGERSPYLSETAITAGVVTGVFPELGGFWLQSLAEDDDPLTSEGLFVNTGDLEIPVLTGDQVQVSGVVQETFQQTQLRVDDIADIQVVSSGNALPVPVELDPPVDEAEAEVYFESLEGMFVQVTEPAIAVAPTNRYGEFALVLQWHGVQRLWQGQPNGHAIIVDDGSSQTHNDRSTLAFAVNAGDQVSGLVGPLAFTFGQYKVEPVTMPGIISQDVSVASLEPLAGDEFSLMTWNVENLFDFQDPHPSSPAMPEIGEYKLSISKVAHTILAAGAPTVVGLQEVENIGVLEDIAAHEALSEFGYQSVLIEGTDSRGIDVGYLVRGDQAKVMDVRQYVAPEGLTSRPPLMVEIDIQGVTVFVLNNHFTSMSGGEAATEPRRDAQAAWNVTVMQEILADNSNALLAVMGDLNSYYDAKPVDTLRAAGLLHVFEALSEEERYTYIYQGASQVLDHILVTPELMDLLRRVDILHVNADFAPAEPGDESPIRKSDHDPAVAVFSLNP